MRPSPEVKNDLALAVRLTPGNDHAINRLRAEYKASRTAEYLRKVIDDFPPLTADQISELQDILAIWAQDRLPAWQSPEVLERCHGCFKCHSASDDPAINGPARQSCSSRRFADRTSVSKHATGGTELKKSDSEYPCDGRTQWDAMAEATSEGKFRATRLALLISVR